MWKILLFKLIVSCFKCLWRFVLKFSQSREIIPRIYKKRHLSWEENSKIFFYFIVKLKLKLKLKIWKHSLSLISYHILLSIKEVWLVFQLKCQLWMMYGLSGASAEVHQGGSGVSLNFDNKLYSQQPCPYLIWHSISY